MFHNRRAHPDIKKTTHRFIDPKKESHSRLRALRTLLGRCNLAHCKTVWKWRLLAICMQRAIELICLCIFPSDYFDSSDSRIFFNSHYSEIFYVFHDVFSMVEANLKTKGQCLKYISRAWQWPFPRILDTVIPWRGRGVLIWELFLLEWRFSRHNW